METTIPDSTSNLEKPINVSENSAEHVSNDAEDATEKHSEKPLHTTRVYNRVPNQVRKELVDRVYKSGESIYEVYCEDNRLLTPYSIGSNSTRHKVFNREDNREDLSPRGPDRQNGSE